MKALFLDRDGIINEIVMRGDVVGSPRNLSELKIRQEFAELYPKIDIPMFVVSNQPDIRRNLMTQTDLDAITNLLKQQFPKLQFSYCIHDDRDQCECRKPKPGLIVQWLKRYRLAPEDGLLIGDSAKDVEAGKQAKMATVLLRTVYNKEAKCIPNFVIDDLNEITQFF